MGTVITTNPDTVVRDAREMTQIPTSITVKGGELIFLNTNLAGERVPVFSSKDTVRVGCHSLTRAAWELLKERVDGKKGSVVSPNNGDSRH